MNERELISANLKVVGFCALLLGIVLCLRGVYDCCIACYALHHPPEMEWNGQDVPEKIRAEFVTKHEQEVMIHRLTYRMKMYDSGGEVIRALVVLCAGLYLCRKGRPIVRFLAESSGDETKV